jgi:lysozyme
MRNVTRRGVTFVSHWEGFSPTPYPDVDHYSIGYGTPSHKGAPRITEAEAQRRLREWLNDRVAPAIPRRARMRHREIDGLASFGFNLGTGALTDSTLGRRLRSDEGKRYQGRKAIYREEIPKWIKAGGEVLLGLKRRRAAEVEVAVHGDYSGRP